MQNTLWKLISVVGVVAIGTFVVVQVQNEISKPLIVTADDAPLFDSNEKKADAETIPSELEQHLASTSGAADLLDPDDSWSLDDNDIDPFGTQFSEPDLSSFEAVDTSVDLANLSESHDPFAVVDHSIIQMADSGVESTQAIAFTEETETADDDQFNFAVDSVEEFAEEFITEPFETAAADLGTIADNAVSDTRLPKLMLDPFPAEATSLADDANNFSADEFSSDFPQPQDEPTPASRTSESRTSAANSLQFFAAGENNDTTGDPVSPFEQDDDSVPPADNLLNLGDPETGVADSTPLRPTPIPATDSSTRFSSKSNHLTDDSLIELELIPVDTDDNQMFELEDSNTTAPLPFADESPALDTRRDRSSSPAGANTRDSQLGRTRLDRRNRLRPENSRLAIPERDSGRSQFNFDLTEEPPVELPQPTDEPGRFRNESPREPVERLRDLPPRRNPNDRLRDLPPREQPAVRRDRDTMDIGSHGEQRQRPEPRTRRRTEVQSANSSSTGILRPHVTVRKQMPRTATLGQPLKYTLVITNEGQTVAEDVIVEDVIPVEAKLDGVDPPADYEKETRKIIWEFAKLESGDSRELQVQITPTGSGVLKSVATVRFKTQVTTTTLVQAPRLTLELVAPREIRVGHNMQLRYIVRNEGNGVATDVMLRSDLPAGLQHPIGNDLEYNIERLAPNDKREIVLDVIASEPGSHTSTAELIFAGASDTTTEATVNIIGQQIQVARRGPERRYVGRSAVYENILSNETVFEASRIRVVEYIPEGMKFEKATHNGIHNPQDRTVTWTLNQLDAGDTKTLKVQLVAMKSGEQESSVTVLENEGFETEARHVTSVEDLHNIGSRMSRLDGPVAVDEEFGFDIAVQNRGTADATNLQLTIDLPDGIKGVSVGKGGPHADPRMNNGQLQYHFQAIERISPQGEMIFRINLKATKSISNSLVKARIRYDQMKNELILKLSPPSVMLRSICPLETDALESRGRFEITVA